MEEMKRDHFYKGLNPKYWHMLAHKVDGKCPKLLQPASCSPEVGKQAEARDPLLWKATITRGIKCYLATDIEEFVSL